MCGSTNGWEIVSPQELDPHIRALAGKRAGLQRRLDIMRADPCDPSLGGYRLSGSLEPKVCGLHLDRGYRLACSTQPAITADDRPRVVLLYVGRREPGHRTDTDIWDILHDLFRVGNPPAGHAKPPCCDRDLPTLDHDALDEFQRSLRRLNRGR